MSQRINSGVVSKRLYILWSRCSKFITGSRPAHIPARRALLAALALLCFAAAPATAQTPGSTVISNTATATYSDGTTNYNTTSNTVTVTVANVSGLTITPDGQSDPSVVSGQTGVLFNFTVTNTGNFADQVRFLASGASVRAVGPGTITAAVIDDGDNVIDAGDTDILGNAGNVDHALAQNASAVVIVRVSINAAATAGQTVQVLLGDAAIGGPSFDNQASTSSANEVGTVSAASVNGTREARGDITVTVQNDAQLRAVLTAPAGPVALGSDITYTNQVCNDGNRPAASMSLGGNAGVYVVAAVPSGTQLSAANAFPAGTLYTVSPLSTAPQSAVWTTTAPGTLSTTTRVAFNAGATLAATTCATAVNMIVTITTTDASTPIYQIADAFATNTVAAVITDQSGDAVTNKGDGNGDYDEPPAGDPVSPTQGFKLPTLLQQIGNVLLGPQGQPGATGPTDQNNDFTERSVNTGIAGVAPGGVTTAGGTLIFVNTVQNTGNSNDTFTLSAPTVPAGFTVGISTTGAAGPFIDVSSGGTTTLALGFGQSADIHVQVVAPAGQTVLTGFSAVLQAASGVTPASTNRTIDRLYTGFVRLLKTATVTNGTGVGGATDAVPGAQIEYVIAYANVMTAVVAGSGNSSLTASNIVITEDGAAGTNNWAAFTTQVVGSAVDANSTGTAGTITGDSAGSNVLTDTVGSLPAGGSGTFRFRRVIN